jgi:hypothetical protein
MAISALFPSLISSFKTLLIRIISHLKSTGNKEKVSRMHANANASSTKALWHRVKSMLTPPEASEWEILLYFSLSLSLSLSSMGDAQLIITRTASKKIVYDFLIEPNLPFKRK